MTGQPENVTQLLLEWSEGDETAFDRLLPLVYDDLRRQARGHLRRERSSHTLQPTALVHEAYLRLVDQAGVRWKSRNQFYAIAAQAMRRILVDHARRRLASKRGSRKILLQLDSDLDFPEQTDREVIAVDDALGALAKIAPRQARVVELRFFGGLSIDEVAQVIEVSPATIKGDWRMARAWLFRHFAGSEPCDGA